MILDLPPGGGTVWHDDTTAAAGRLDQAKIMELGMYDGEMTYALEEEIGNPDIFTGRKRNWSFSGNGA